MTDYMILIVLGAIVFLVINGLLANEFHNIAIDKGYYEEKYFWIAFFLGIPGYLLIAAMPDKNARPANTSENAASSVNDDELPEL